MIAAGGSVARIRSRSAGSGSGYGEVWEVTSVTPRTDRQRPLRVSMMIARAGEATHILLGDRSMNPRPSDGRVARPPSLFSDPSAFWRIHR
jgi:hypothetical protein